MATRLATTYRGVLDIHRKGCRIWVWEEFYSVRQDNIHRAVHLVVQELTGETSQVAIYE